LAAALAGLSAASPAADWPQFRGPNGSGVAETTGLPVEFGLGKNVEWRTEAPFSRSSPIVAGGRVYLTAYEGEKLLTFCLDRRTGRIEWRREILRARPARIYKANDPASPSPASDGTNVYAFFGDFGLVSYGPDGNERWRLPLGPFHNFYGMAASPIVAGDTVALVCDQEKNSFLTAVGKDTGKVRWRVERPETRFSWTTPAVVTPDRGGPQLIVPGSNRVDAHSLSTGDRQWWMGGLGWQPVAVPVIGDGAAYLVQTSGGEPLPTFATLLQQRDTDRDGRLIREEFRGHDLLWEHFEGVDTDRNGYLDENEHNALRAGFADEAGVVAVRLGGRGRLPSQDLLWRQKKNTPTVPSPLLYKGVLYMVKGGGIVTTLDPATGRILKEGRVPEAISPYYSSPVAGDDKVFLAGEAGKVTVLKAGREWEILAVNDLGEECYATPAIADGRIYIRTRSALYCFRKRE